MLERGYGELLEPLSGQQGAPVGFLWLARAISSVAGMDERLLRLPSLLAGVALLPLVWLLAVRVASRRTAAVAVALVAVSPGLVRYSTEFKQYALDAVVAVGLLLLADRADRSRRARDLAVLAVAGAAAAWCSHPAVLVLAGVGLHLLVRPLRERSPRDVARLVPVGALWAASLGALWWVSLRDLADNEFLTGYWQAGFPADLAPRRFAGWAVGSVVDLLDDLGGFAAPAVTAAGAAAGIAVLAARHGARSATLLLAPLPGLLVAAALEQYPFRGRLALFVLPSLLVGLAALAEVRRRPLRLVALAAVAALALGPALRSAEELVDPTPFPESRPVLEHLAAHVRPGEEIWVHGLAEAPFAVYGDDLGLEAAARTSWRAPHRCPLPGAADHEGTVWIVFAYTHSAAPPEEAAILRSHLDAHGRRLEVFRAHDAFVARYDLGAPPTDPTGARVTPTTGCLEVTPAAR